MCVDVFECADVCECLHASGQSGHGMHFQSAYAFCCGAAVNVSALRQRAPFGAVGCLSIRRNSEAATHPKTSALRPRALLVHPTPTRLQYAGDGCGSGRSKGAYSSSRVSSPAAPLRSYVEKPTYFYYYMNGRVAYMYKAQICM